MKYYRSGNIEILPKMQGQSMHSDIIRHLRYSVKWKLDVSQQSLNILEKLVGSSYLL